MSFRLTICILNTDETIGSPDYTECTMPISLSIHSPYGVEFITSIRNFLVNEFFTYMINLEFIDK